MEKKITYVLPETPEEFLSNLIDAYPEEDFPSLRKVMSLGKVEYSNKAMGGQQMTACVVNTKPYTLIFGKDFMETNMETTEDAVYVLSHELTHLVLDHFAKDIREEFEKVVEVEVQDKETGEKKKEYQDLGDKAVHIIVDCQVNATVVNSLTDPKYHEFIKRFYKQDIMPSCFFRPDGIPKYDVAGFHPVDPLNPDKDPEPILEDIEPEYLKVLQDLHKKLYSKDGITNKELIEGLLPWFQKNQDQLDEAIKKLLGNHRDMMKDRTGNASDGGLEDLVKGYGKDVSDFIKKEKGEEQAEEGNGQLPGEGGELILKEIQTSLDRIEYSRKIKDNLKKVDVVSPSSRIFKAIDAYSPKVSRRSVIPNFRDPRTASVFAVTGKLPIFHKRPEVGTKVIVPCYLDVSGSQDHVIPHTIPAVIRLKRLIGNSVFCFSTVISPTKIEVLSQGKYHTTGGTDFNPVIKHMLENRYRRAVILTDGQAYLSEELAEQVKKHQIDITVGWTEPNPSYEPLQSIASKTFFVFDND